MESRPLPALERSISSIGIGTWQLGADWGEVTASEAEETLQAAVDSGVTFIDTADVYGDGRSERFVGAFVQSHPEAGLTVATKMGRRLEQTYENYSREHFRAWNDRSRQNLGVETIDLVQLHGHPARSSRPSAPGTGSTRWSPRGACAPTG